MRIALSINARLPVQKYGGTERVVAWLATALVNLGHEVTLFSLPGTHIPGVKHISVPSEAELVPALRKHAERLDIVHFHSGSFELDELPSLWTLHGNTAPDAKLVHPNTLCISQDQAKRQGRNDFVYNGIPPDEFKFYPEPKRELLFFSKVNRKVKGAPRAIQLARLVNRRLDLAGGRRYHLLKSGGLLSSFHPNIHFHGMVGGARKNQLMGESKALLFPIEWPEPFGLAVIESMLCGTPVLATPLGSMPELIKPEGGCLFQTDEEFLAILDEALSLDRLQCREYAADNFSSLQCALNHLSIYEKILNGATLA